MAKYKVQRKVYSLALTHGASATTVSASSQTLTGLLRQANVITPASVDGAATLTLNILDEDSIVVYTKGSMAANGNVVDTPSMPIPLAGTYTVQIVFSANQTATDTVTKAKLLIEDK